MIPEETKYMDMRFDAMTTLVNAQFQAVNERLDKINGKVGKHDDAISEINLGRQKQRDWVENRETSCPQLKRIQDLETKDKVNMSLKQFVIGGCIFIATMIGAVYSTVKIVEAHDAKVLIEKVQQTPPTK